MLRLEFKDRRQPGVWMVESAFGIGSATGNHLLIEDASVSERHAEITKQDEHLYLSDLGSFSGTRVNGQKISQRYQLRAGDQISLGKVALEIVEPKHSAEPIKNMEVKAQTDWKLTAINGDLKGQSFIVRGIMLLGRAESCDLVINDAHLSRRHAELRLSDGVLRIIDLNSSNGTRVNGELVSEKVLSPGDKISFDKLVFLVAGPRNPAAVPKHNDIFEDEDEATVFSVGSAPPTVSADVAQSQLETKVAAKMNTENKPSIPAGAPNIPAAKADKPSKWAKILKVGVIVLSLLVVAAVVALFALES